MKSLSEDREKLQPSGKIRYRNKKNLSYYNDDSDLRNLCHGMSGRCMAEFMHQNGWDSIFHQKENFSVLDVGSSPGSIIYMLLTKFKQCSITSVSKCPPVDLPDKFMNVAKRHPDYYSRVK